MTATRLVSRLELDAKLRYCDARLKHREVAEMLAIDYDVDELLDERSDIILQLEIFEALEELYYGERVAGNAVYMHAGSSYCNM